jgi:hypothetical protein
MTGGYLVLERPNAGLVLSTNARFYAIVKPVYPETKPDSWSWVCSLFFYSYNLLNCILLDTLSINHNQSGVVVVMVKVKCF